MAEVYYTKYKGWFCDTDGQAVNVEFKRRYTIDPNDPIQLEPVIKDLIFSGHDSEPVVISYKQDSITTKLNAINGSECSIGITAVGDFELSDLYTGDEKEWLVVISGADTWQGFLIPDDCEEPFESKPYEVRVSATDALGTLDEIPFSMDDGTLYRSFMSDLAVLRICLEKTGLSLPYTIGINTSVIASLGVSDPNQCILSQLYIDTNRFIDEDGVAFSCKEVLRSILERHSAKLHQVNGRWNIVNELEKSFGTVKGWLFDANLNPNGSVPNMLYNVIAGGLDREIQPVGTISLQKAYLNSTAYYQYGYPSNKLQNGSMNLWTTKPSGLPDFWDISGAITAIGKARQVDGVDTSDYFIEMSGQGDGYIYHTDSPLIRANEKAVINFDIYSPEAQNIQGNGREIFELYILVKTDDGAWYGNNGWQATFTYYRITYRLSDIRNQIRVSFEVVSRAVDYRMTTGVRQYQSLDGGTNTITQINNVEIQQKEQNELTKIALGEYNRQTSTAKQTFKPDPILLLHGTETSEDRTSRISLGMPNPLVSVPVQYSRANLPGENKYLLQIVANTQLRLHSRPYRIFEADFHGYADISPNTVLTTDLLPGTYTFLSGTFDLKTNIHNLRFAEILTDDINYIEEQRQDYGAENDKNKIDVANPVGVGNVGQIQYNPSLFAPAGSEVLAASNVETQAGTVANKYVSPSTLANWWAYVRGLAQTISGVWNFTARPTFNGAALITAADVPAPVEVDTLASVTTRGNTTTNDISVGQLVTSGGNSAVNLRDRLDNTKIWALFASGNVFNIFNTISASSVLTAKSDGVPVSGTDIVRLQDLQAFKGSDNVLSKSANYTVVVGDFGSNGNVTIYVDTTGGNRSITLPTPTVMNGYTANIIKTSSDVNSVVVVATINGQTNDLLSNQYDAGSYKSNGVAIFAF